MERRDRYQEQPPHLGQSTPMLQRMYWVIASIAAILAIGGGLLGVSNILDSVLWEIVSLALSFGLVVAIFFLRPRNQFMVDWEDALHRLQEFRAYQEEQNIALKYVQDEFLLSREGEDTAWSHLKSLLEFKVFTKAMYRAAIISGRNELAQDFISELEQIEGWKSDIINALDRIYTDSEG